MGTKDFSTLRARIEASEAEPISAAEIDTAKRIMARYVALYGIERAEALTRQHETDGSATSLPKKPPEK